jgi:hypothetical protein
MVDICERLSRLRSRAKQRRRLAERSKPATVPSASVNSQVAARLRVRA